MKAEAFLAGLALAARAARGLNILITVCAVRLSCRFLLSRLRVFLFH